MKITLIGFMGSGKSTVAALLAQQSGLKHIEMDREVLTLTHYASIAELVNVEGEPAFRTLEAQVAAKLRNASNVVISSGGGAILNPRNIEALKASGGILCYLHAEFATIVARVPLDGTRPLFKDTDSARTLYSERLPKYREAADIVVTTDAVDPDEVVSLLRQSLASYD